MTNMFGSADLGVTDLFGQFSFLQGRGFRTHLRPHVHDFYVFGVVDSGEVCLTLGDRSWIAGPGAVIALPPYVVHTEIATTSSGWSFTYLYPTEPVVRQALRVIGPGGGEALSFDRPVFDDAVIAAAIRQVHRRLQLGESAARSCEAVAHLCQALRDRHCRRPITPRRVPSGIEQARSLIARGGPRSVTVRELASVAGLSPYHFSRVFHEIVGLPPHKYFEQARVARAHTWILRGKSLSDVTFELGYADQAHLTRQFQRGSMTTPGQYALMVRRAYRAHRD